MSSNRKSNRDKSSKNKNDIFYRKRSNRQRDKGNKSSKSDKNKTEKLEKEIMSYRDETLKLRSELDGIKSLLTEIITNNKNQQELISNNNHEKEHNINSYNSETDPYATDSESDSSEYTCDGDCSHSSCSNNKKDAVKSDASNIPSEIDKDNESTISNSKDKKEVRKDTTHSEPKKSKKALNNDISYSDSSESDKIVDTFSNIDSDDFKDKKKQTLNAEILMKLSIKNKNRDTFNPLDFERFFYLLPIAMCITSNTGDFLAVNNGFCSMLGYDDGDIIQNNMKIYDFIHPDDIESTITAQDKLAKGGFVASFENRYLHKMGGYFWISWQAIEYENKYYAIASKAPSSDEFLSRVAHELKTPLNSIMGFADIIRLDNSMNEQNAHYMTQIIKSANSLNVLVNDILDLSKISVERLIMEDIVIYDAIMDSIETFMPDLVNKNISLKFDKRNSYCEVKCDYQKLLQVFKNLISNAIKYNKDHGKITITCKYIKGKLDISVKDTGIGIDKKNFPYLYKPFNRLGIGHKYPGSGIGLSLVKKIVDIFGGSIKCESIVNSYTKFTISLPAREKHDKNENENYNLILNGEQDKGTRILYIEDTDTNIQLIDAMLGRLGDIEFNYAYTGKEGLKAIKDTKPQILLLDLGLPDIDGSDVFQIAKKEGYLNDTQVIVISAEGRPKKIEELYKMGIDHYVSKPINIDKLMRHIQNIIKKTKHIEKINKGTESNSNNNNVMSDNNKKDRDLKIKKVRKRKKKKINKHYFYG